MTNKIKKNANKVKFLAQKGSNYLSYLLGSETAPGPSSMNVEITWNCNLNCFMCPRHRAQSFKVDNKNMSLAEFRQIVEKIPSCRHINIVGGGEPFMNADFIEMLRFAESKGITVSFNSNGILLSEENILKLPQNVNLLWISIDSPVKGTYRNIRSGADLDVLLRNLETLRKLRKDIQIIFQPIIMKMSMEEMPKMIDVAKKVGASINYVQLLAFDEDLDKQSAHHFKEEYGEVLKKIWEEARKKGVAVSDRPLSPNKRSCTEPWFCPTISIEGDIYACCYVYAARGRVPSFREYYLGESIDMPEGQYRMGNVFNDSFKDIWNGNAYRLLRKEVLRTNKPFSMFPAELKELRKKINPKKRYSYCEVCLARWKCAC